MSRGLELRPAVPGDLESILRLERDSFGGDTFSRRQLRYLITKARGAFFVALQNGETAGYISVLVSRRHGQARIYSLAVGAAFRGQGVAAAMLEAGLAFARQKSCRAVFLEVRPENAAAVALYRKKGFAARALLPAYYHDGAPALSMMLRLQPPEGAAAAFALRAQKS